MFGTNKVRSSSHSSSAGTSLWVQEIFGTIQGEGPFAGCPAIFIRLAGCNLRCHFCDTDFESSEWHPDLEEIGDKIAIEYQVCRTKLVVLTGGEPLRQNVVPLLRMLNTAGFRVQVETAGTLMAPELYKYICEVNVADEPALVTIVCSPKTPRIQPLIETLCADYKYIIRVGEVDDDDGLPDVSTQVPGRASRIYRPHVYAGGGPTIWVQPMMEYDVWHAPVVEPWDKPRPPTYTVDQNRTRANTDLCVKIAMRHGYRVSVQAHKILNVP
jgi:7-carboxy-7-deazaguanine synthase